MIDNPDMRFIDKTWLAKVGQGYLSHLLAGRMDRTREALNCNIEYNPSYESFTDKQKVRVLESALLYLAKVYEDDLCYKELYMELQLLMDAMERDNVELKAELDQSKKEEETCSQKLKEAEGKVAKLTKKKQDSEALIKELQGVVKKLKSQCSQPKRPVTTSENSSLPPSQNPISEKSRIKSKQLSTRKKSELKVGGQAGHKGVTAKRMEASEKKDIYPKDVVIGENGERSYICPNCGTSIPESAFTTKQIHQIQELANELNLMATDYHQKVAKCPKCGTEVQGEFEAFTKGWINYGPKITAFIALLNNRHDIPESRIKELFSDLFGQKISTGTVNNLMVTAADYCKPEWYSSREAVMNSDTVNADGTTCGHSVIEVAEVGGSKGSSPTDASETEKQGDDKTEEADKVKRKVKTRYIWGFSCPTSVFLIQKNTRSATVLTELYPDGLEKSTLITDRYSGYFIPGFKVGNHQICLQHIERNLQQKIDAYPRFDWPKKVQCAIQTLIHRYNCGEDRSLLYDKYKNLLHELLTYTIKEGELPDKNCWREMVAFQKNLADNEDYLLTFLLEKDVEPTNNSAELVVRPTKTKLKVCGNFRTDYGAYMYAIIQSVVQTAKKNKENVFAKLCEVISRAEVVKEIEPWDDNLRPKYRK